MGSGGRLPAGCPEFDDLQQQQLGQGAEAAWEQEAVPDQDKELIHALSVHLLQLLPDAVQLQHQAVHLQAALGGDPGAHTPTVHGALAASLAWPARLFPPVLLTAPGGCSPIIRERRHIQDLPKVWWARLDAGPVSKLPLNPTFPPLPDCVSGPSVSTARFLSQVGFPTGKKASEPVGLGCSLF